ncbi:MAG: DNRLRE domain-containing protein [Planctomycetia bacterium]|nr:DNRLRE domain-containing protein [Planctomycetia bacterium]
MKRINLFALVILFGTVVMSFSQQRTELKDKRTFNSKTFVNSDNSYTTVITGGLVHYLDSKGEFLEIDRNIVLSPTEYDYEVTQGFYHAYFKSDLSEPGAIAFETTGGGGFTAQLSGLGYMDQAGKKYEIIYQPRLVQPVVNQNTIIYPNIFPGIDVKFAYCDTKLKEELFIHPTARKSLQAPKSFKKPYLVAIYQLEMNMPTTKPFAKAKKIDKDNYEGEERITFRDIKGSTSFYFPVDFAYLVSGGDSLTVDYNRTMRKWFLKKNDKQLLLTGVPDDWFQTLPAGTVVLDPQVSVDAQLNLSKDTNICGYTGSTYQYRSYGVSSRILMESANKWRGLVYFDLSWLPLDVTVQAADLYFYVYDSAHDGPGSIYAYKADRYWKEGTGSGATNSETYSGASWRERFYGDNLNDGNNPWNEADADWATVGGDYSGLMAQANVTGTGAFSLDILQTVQDWVTDANSNYGVLLKTDESASPSYNVWVRSSNYSTTPSQRPRLELTYTFETTSIYYVRDAAGQVIATYRR